MMDGWMMDGWMMDGWMMDGWMMDGWRVLFCLARWGGLGARSPDFVSVEKEASAFHEKMERLDN